ncbi:MAG TPA: hydrogenase maturation nickel metallochaperone HypA [Vicinamibacterales bacterium]|jgi:hydrogenase nickel incorporation protein HypA/HybF|nr:hydrogenase maturation nickel metallochaperone HypA [Vicinamibacterales bacterium]
MHEYSIVQALYDSVVAEAAARGAVAVHGVSVRIGELSGVDTGLLDTAWRTFRVRTICEDAAMDIEIVAARWECRVCRGAVPRGGILRCPSCGAPMRLAEGDEIVLNRVVMEVP